jgi:tetratricopeptide (TPR) repeat protein
MSSARPDSFTRYCSVRLIFALSVLVAAKVARAEQEPTDAAARLGRLIDVGEKAKDVESAISAINDGLKLVDELQPWSLQRSRAHTKASLLVSLGRRYRQRRVGVHADNLEGAIASFQQALREVRQDDAPALWCRIQYNLGMALADRAYGSSIDNIEASIAAFQIVEACYSEGEYSEQWSMLQRSIARAYYVRVQGSRADNLERALAGFKASLSVANSQPESLARTQTYLGDALVARIRGDHAANVEEAIKAYNAALAVRTQDRLPELWASTQFGLAHAYVERTEGDRAENIDRAIALYKSALTVRTFEAMPRQWAATQLNLGSTYRIRMRGNFDENVEQAVEAYKSALRVYTKEASPRPWAIAKHSLAATLTLRKTGGLRKNLSDAIDAYKEALSVVSRDANPRDHFVISRGLARAFMLNGDWEGARAAYAEAVGTFRLMFNEASDDEAEASALISTTGPTIDEAAYVSAAVGDLEDAFRLLNEGRARLLSLALREQTAALSPEERAKHKELVAEIQRWTRWAETAEGSERISAIERAASLRQEVRALTRMFTPDAESARRGFADLLGRVLERGQAVVAPIVTEAGAKLLVATASNGAPSISMASSFRNSRPHV